MMLLMVHLPNTSSLAVQLQHHNPRPFRNSLRTRAVIRLRLLTGGWAHHLATTDLSVIFRVHHLSKKGRS